MLKLFTAFFLLSLSFTVLSQETSALEGLAKLFNEQTTPIYRVDFIVLKHLEIEEKDKEERWPTLEKLEFNEDLIGLSPVTELLVDLDFLNNNKLKDEHSLNYQVKFKDNSEEILMEDVSNEILTGLPFRFYEKITLSSPIEPINKRLKLSKGYRVLFESSWYQPVFSKSNASPLYVEAIDNEDKIYGLLNIYKDRYLHSEIILRFANMTPEQNFLTDVKTSNFNDILDSLSESKNTPNDDGRYWMDTILSQIIIRFEGFRNTKIDIETVKLNKVPLIEDNKFYKDMYELREERKMEAEELYYIDHPYFGVLIRLTLIK
jgi:hypothetical protein